MYVSSRNAVLEYLVALLLWISQMWWVLAKWIWCSICLTCSFIDYWFWSRLCICWSLIFHFNDITLQWIGIVWSAYLGCLTVESRCNICNLKVAEWVLCSSQWLKYVYGCIQESAQKMMEGVAYDGIVVDGRRIFFEYRWGHIMTSILYAVSRGVRLHWLMSNYWGSVNAARISDTVYIWREQNGLLMEQGCTSHSIMLK